MRNFLFMVTFFLFFSTIVLASCTVNYGGCPTDKYAIFSLAKENNAHAADYNYYSYKVCCPSVQTSLIKTSCESYETEVIDFYKLNNTHAAKKGFASYKLCVKFDYPMSCIINSTCNAGLCVASLLQETNSHLGPCGFYPYQICCGNMTVTIEAGGPYVKHIEAPTIIVVGEVRLVGEPTSNANVSIKIYKDSSLVASKDVVASSDGKYFATFPNFDFGAYVVNVTANYSYATAYSIDTFSVIGKLSGCVAKTVSLSGTAQDYFTGEIVPSGTVKIYIVENGDEFTTSFTEGKWAVTFTSCLFPDISHKAIVQIIDSSTGRISWSEIQFRA
ncbi:MAG: hypothetical protein QW423_00025 [Candidatus Aenigmatarchaeota archaeon]